MLEDKVIVITGAGSGLGRAMSISLASHGATIILVGRTEEKLKETAQLMEGGKADIFSADITSFSQIEGLFSFIKEEYDGLDILINNAGLGRFGNLEDLKLTTINQMIDTNLKGTIFCSKQALSLMKPKDRGQIINIISTAGKRGKDQESVYCASKFGVSGLTKSLQQELKETGIKVTGVYVGGMESPFWDGIREETSGFMSPAEVAEVILDVVRKSDNMVLSEVVIDRK